MTEPHHFSARISDTIRSTCVQAVTYMVEHGKYEPKLIDAFNELDRKLARTRGPAAIQFSLDDAQVLETVLKFYLEEGPLRSDSKVHQELTELRFALTDYVDTYTQKFVSEVVEALGDEGTIPDEPQIVDDFEKGIREKRDQIFKHIVGTPQMLNIWGQVAHSVGDKEPAFASSHVVKPRVFMYRSQVASFEMSPKRIMAMVRKNAYVPEPLADKEVDQDLTGGEPCRFNERMQQEAHTVVGVPGPASVVGGSDGEPPQGGSTDPHC